MGLKWKKLPYANESKINKKTKLISLRNWFIWTIGSCKHGFVLGKGFLNSAKSTTDRCITPSYVNICMNYTPFDWLNAEKCPHKDMQSEKVSSLVHQIKLNSVIWCLASFQVLFLNSEFNARNLEIPYSP